MTARRIKPWAFAAIVLVALPAAVHAMNVGLYVIDSNGNHSTFAIGPISTTLPYVCLALVFLAHSELFRALSFHTAYGGAVLAWMCMMAFTMFIISHPRGPALSSTGGIAVFFTPFFYIPFLVVGYLVGAVSGRLYERLRSNGAEHEA